MKYIKVTQALKDKNPELFNGYAVDEFYRRGIPNKFHGTENLAGGYKQRTDLHDEDGWKEVINEPILENQKRGSLVENENNFTYPAVDKTDSELKNEKLSDSSFKKQELIMQIQERKVIEEFQVIEEDSTLLDNKDIFPIWDELPDGQPLEITHKVQGFKDGELALFRIEQTHNKQSNWIPESTPALFTRVAEAGQILPWVQPTGAQDAYSAGTEVMHNGKNWISTVDANVWEPGVYGWTEKV